MKFLLSIFILFSIIQSYALTPSERLNLVGSADLIVTGKVLSETIAYPLRADEAIKNISVKVIDQYKGGVRSLFDITIAENEPSLKIGSKYLFFLKYSLSSNSISPFQKNNWNFIEGTDYLLLIDLIKRYPITIEITNPEATLFYTKKNFIQCKITKTPESKVEILSVKLNLIMTSEEKINNINIPPLISLDKAAGLKLNDKITNYNLPVKLRNTDDKEDYQAVVQPVFYLKINGIPCEYSGMIVIYNISNKEI